MNYIHIKLNLYQLSIALSKIKGNKNFTYNTLLFNEMI